MQNGKGNHSISVVGSANRDAKQITDIRKVGEPEDHGNEIDDDEHAAEDHIQTSGYRVSAGEEPGHEQISAGDEQRPHRHEDGERHDGRRRDVNIIIVVVVVEIGVVVIVVFGLVIQRHNIARETKLDDGEDDGSAQEGVESSMDDIHGGELGWRWRWRAETGGRQGFIYPPDLFVCSLKQSEPHMSNMQRHRQASSAIRQQLVYNAPICLGLRLFSYLAMA